ncbi:OmpA family protein [Echinicola vietnamensis]|uniref:Outer membrane protein/peptidoglycan-associated (Lipo)protein n=1 Tax=Echinicola vietnamensis (strain DSM 17526 / LMG 23754 / KMM 6221) TaxID=926556 RepID=L0G3J0_ECHVK|nr:OmpA family protein [Echinicola vietnamensis]AGA80809.1 outer membrane protein/peptidoglycan-associated (lipo)protein [Echinicola vietnamensis DSM 17526]
MRITQIVLFLIFISSQALGQQYTSENRRAIKLYQEGEDLSMRRRYDEAQEKYADAVKKDEGFLEAYKKWSQLLLKKGSAVEALQVAKAGELKSQGKVDFMADFSWLITNIYLKSGDFDAAIRKFHDSQGLFSSKVKSSSSFKAMEQKMAFIQKELKNEKVIHKERLESPLNQFHLQYFPVLTADSKQLLFTKRDGVTPSMHEDIFTSNWDQGSWSPPKALSESINTIHNEGTCTISADGNILIYTSCDAPDSFGSCDLYIAYKVGGQWQAPMNMGEKVNSRYWDSQPSLSADGSILFFSSNRRGGMGGNDIYYSVRESENSWSEPINVGESINTEFDEVSPFIYFNNELLFFASDGHMGFGGMDLFNSKIVHGAFQQPVNLGYPINDHLDQLALFITAQQDYAYYTENSLKDGALDRSYLYRFAFPKEIDLGERLVVTGGKVRNEKTGEPIVATLSLVDLENDSTMYEFRSEGDSGRFMMIYPDKASSGLYVEKKGFLPRIYNVEKDSLKDIKDMDIGLKPVAKGEEFLFENVFFDFDKADLKPSSKSSLLRLKKFLDENPDVHIVIEGHTDNVGDADYNRDLSLRRAASVRDYLLQRGIDGERLTVSGYGDKRPIMSNDTATGRSKNRRIEILVD